MTVDEICKAAVKIGAKRLIDRDSTIFGYHESHMAIFEPKAEAVLEAIGFREMIDALHTISTLGAGWGDMPELARLALSKLTGQKETPEP